MRNHGGIPEACLSDGLWNDLGSPSIPCASDQRKISHKMKPQLPNDITSGRAHRLIDCDVWFWRLAANAGKHRRTMKATLNIYGMELEAKE
jgi:hypothetical protein